MITNNIAQFSQFRKRTISYYCVFNFPQDANYL
jgi:hypothetical protein